MNEQSTTTRSTGLNGAGKRAGVSSPRIGLLHDDDAGDPDAVSTPVGLGRHRWHTPWQRPAAAGNRVKPPSRRAQVDGGLARDHQLEFLQGVIELVTAPAYEPFRSHQHDVISRLDRVAGFCAPIGLSRALGRPGWRVWPVPGFRIARAQLVLDPIAATCFRPRSREQVRARYGPMLTFRFVQDNRIQASQIRRPQVARDFDHTPSSSVAVIAGLRRWSE